MNISLKELNEIKLKELNEITLKELNKIPIEEFEIFIIVKIQEIKYKLSLYSNLENEIFLENELEYFKNLLKPINLKNLKKKFNKLNLNYESLNNELIIIEKEFNSIKLF